MTTSSLISAWEPLPSDTNVTALTKAVNEVYNNLVTQCGLSVHASDTGQLAVPAVGLTYPTQLTTFGYYIFKFNDTLQATKPVFMKLEFGSGTLNELQMYLTVGTAWSANGIVDNGVITNIGGFSGGTGYNGGAAGTFQIIPTGGSGVGLTLNVTLNSSGVPSAISVNQQGNGYLSTDSISFNSANMTAAGAAAGGTGSCTLSSLTVSTGLIGTKRMPVNTTFALASVVQPYYSWYVYNSTYGFCALAWKNPQQINYCYGGFVVMRSNNTSTGAATGDAVVVMANASGNTAANTVSGGGCMESLSTLTGARIPATPSQAACGNWAPSPSGFPMAAQMTYGTTSGKCNVVPVWIQTPAIQVSAYLGVAISSEFPIACEQTFAMSAGLSLTFMSVGAMFGGQGLYLGNAPYPNIPGSTMMILWQ